MFDTTLTDAKMRESMGLVTIPLASPTFEDYLRAMDAYLKNVVRRQVRHHPYLEEDDLKQEATKVLWDCWDKFVGKKPFEDICKMGTNAMKQQMNIVWYRSRARGEGAASMLYLDAHISYSSDTEFHETIEDTFNRPDVPIETRGEFYSYCSGLTEVETAILTEFLNPCDATVKAMEDLVAARQSDDKKIIIVSIRNVAVAQSLKLNPAVVAAAWRKLQKVVSASLAGKTVCRCCEDGIGSHRCRYCLQNCQTKKECGSTEVRYDRQEDDMETLVIDPSELPGDEEEVAAPAAKKPTPPTPQAKTPPPAEVPESMASPAAEPAVKAKRAYKTRGQAEASGGSSPAPDFPPETVKQNVAPLSDLLQLRLKLEHQLLDINYLISLARQVRIDDLREKSGSRTT